MFWTLKFHVDVYYREQRKRLLTSTNTLCTGSFTRSLSVTAKLQKRKKHTNSKLFKSVFAQRDPIMSKLFWFLLPLCFCREMYVSFGGLLMLLRGDPAHISHFELDQRLFLLMRKLWDSFVWSFFGLDQDLSYVQLCFWCYAHESAIVPKQVLRTVSTSCIINYQLLQFKYALCSKFQKIIAWNHTSLDKNSRKQCYVLLLFWHTCKHLTKWIQKNSKCSVRLDQYYQDQAGMLLCDLVNILKSRYSCLYPEALPLLPTKKGSGVVLSLFISRPR